MTKRKGQLIEVNCSICNKNSYFVLTELATYHTVECNNCRHLIKINDWPKIIKNFKLIGNITGSFVKVENSDIIYEVV